MDLSNYVERLREIARRAHTESKLEVEATAVLRECLADFGVRFDPAINETLKSLGLSQVDADRPDGVFGHIVYDLAFRRFSCGSGGGGEECCEGAGNFA